MSTTLIFKELSLMNFLSFGNSPTVIDLSEPGTISIEGQNLDAAGGPQSNGAGKTSIIQAICYALYNKPFDNISLNRLINATNATKNTLMVVRLTFEKGGEEFEIVRTRGEQYTISIHHNGEDITPGKGVIECDALIESIIGISYDLFTKTIIFSGNSAAFLQLPIALQRTQIEELFNITLLSEKATKLRELTRQTEQDLKIQEAIVKQQEVAHELHHKHIKEAEARVTRWEADRSVEVAEIKRTLDVLGTIDFELEQLLHDEKANLVQEGAYLTATLAPIKKDQQQLIKSVEKHLDEQAHLTKAKCPYCLQQLIDAPKRLQELEVTIGNEMGELSTLERTIFELTNQAKMQQQRLQEVEASIQHIDLKGLLVARENVSVLINKLQELEQGANPHMEALVRLQNEAKREVELDKLDTLHKRIEHQQFLLKLLTNKDSFLRRRILNKTIPFLNDRINEYTRRLGLPHVVKFDTDMSCTVSEFGRELDFGNLSAGEKKRVNTALSLAFRDVLHHLHARTNLLLIDELDGALDSSGLDSVIRILKEKSREEDLGIFIISHHPNISGRLDRTMVVQKQNGFSTIIES